MPKLKAEFRKPKLTLYNTNYVALGVLTNKTHLSAHNIILNKQVNETPSLTFDIPMGGLIDGDSTELLIKFKNDYFVIKEISMSDGDTGIISVRAEHTACELKGIMVSYFEDLIGETPQNMWDTVVANSSMSDVIGNKYIFETDIIDTFRYLGSEDEKSVFEYLLTIAQQFDSCLLFTTDADEMIHVNLQHGDINRNKFIRKGNGLKQLDLKFNTESLFTKMIPFGATDEDGVELNIIDVNDGKSYITNYNYYLAKGMSQAEIDSSPLCNQECIYRNEDIYDAEELLRTAQEELKRLSEPVVEGNVSTIDLNVFEGSLYLSPILCEKIIVVDKDLKYSISCKITSVSYNFENPLESQIGISNVIKYSSTLKDLVQTGEIIDKVITSGENGKPNLNASKVKGIIDGHITQLKYSMEDNITDVTDAVVLFENRITGDDMFGALAIGSRGLLISRQLDQVTNQWVWTTALDAKGLSTQVVSAIEINGSQIRGDKILSYDERTWIDLNDGTFNLADKISYDGETFSIKLSDNSDFNDWKNDYEQNKADVNKEIEEMKDAMENFEDTISDSFSDGIITKVERIRINDSLTDLAKEKADVDGRYALIYNDVKLIGDEKTALSRTYSAFESKYRSLVETIRGIIADDEATGEEKTIYLEKLSEYNATIPPLSVAFDDALKCISKNEAQTQIGDLQGLLEEDIKNAMDSLDDLEETMNSSFRDGIIEEAEYNSIKESVSRLDSEKLDIDRNYENLYNNANLVDPVKSTYKVAYNNYVKAHNNLIQYIETTIGDRVATESEINNIRTKLDAYDDALATYKVEQNNALNAIADNSSTKKIDEYIELVEADIEDVNDKLNKLNTDIGGAIADGVLEKAELLIIENSITELEKEKEDIVQRYDTTYGNSNLKGNAKTKLETKYNEYIAKHSALITAIEDMVEDMVATSYEKLQFERAVENYKIALAELSVAFDEAFNEISKNVAQNISNTLKQELQGNINDVLGVVDALDEYVDTAFKDGILTEVEKEGIRTHLKVLTTEKKDITQQYTTLYGLEDLIGTPKTNLEMAYNAYITTYNTLVDFVEDLLEKTEIKPADEVRLNELFDEHDSKLTTYSKRVNEAIDSIAEEKKNKLKNTVDAQINALKDSIKLTVKSEEFEEFKEENSLELKALEDMSDDLKSQLDGKIETFYQATDPSTKWTTSNLKTQHKGDIWHDTSNNVTYRWNGSAWEKLSDADAEEAKALASTKARVFTSKPAPPYYKGDLWSQGATGDLLRCNVTRKTGTHVSTDWVKASKYTDDATAIAVAEDLANNYYNKTDTLAQIDVAKKSITATVTSVNTKVNALGETVSSLGTRMSTAEEKIKDDAIIQAVSGTYLTKEDASSTYATTSTLSQTQTSIEAKFTCGGVNLVRNSNFADGLAHWSNWGSPTTRTVKDSHLGFTKALYLVTSGTNQGVTQTISKLEAGVEYAISAYVDVSSGQCALQIQDGSTYRNVTSTGTGKQWLAFSFIPSSTSVSVQIGRNGGGSNGSYYFTAIQLERGSIRTAWTSNTEELYSGITTIDKDGITVSHSDVSTKTLMKANGFFINDKNGDVIAELSSANQWSILRADEVYAQNIRRVYMGEANLYIDHSKETCGTGTSSSPFNSFSALTSHFEDKGSILEKDVTVNVVSTGNVSDNLDIRGLSGRGTLTIKLATTLVLNSNSVAECAMYFYDCNNIITVNGGRSAYNSADGALLNKWGCGVRFTKCKYGRVEKIAIDSNKNNKIGVMFDATDGIVDKVDTCNSYHGLWATRGSQAYQYDCCGSASTSFYSGEGALILIGGEANGIKINGSYRRASGNILDFGTNPAGRTSYRTPPAVPATQTYTQSFTSSGYGYYSVGQACWNPNGQKVYQGDWGYGNNKGIYLLPNSSINSFYSGSSIVSGATIKLTRANSGGYSSAQNVYLCGTTATAVGSGSNPSVTKSYGNIGTLAWGETKTFTLPSAFVSDLKAGTIKSIMFYTSDGSNYILFGNSCTLTLKCNK